MGHGVLHINQGFGLRRRIVVVLHLAVPGTVLERCVGRVRDRWDAVLIARLAG